MTTRLWSVKPHELQNDEITDQLFAFFRQAEFDTHGEWSVHDTVKGLEDEKFKILAAIDGDRILSVCCVGLLDLANHDRIGRFWWCVAEPNTMPRWIHHFEEIAEWMRDQGCSRIDGRFRKGWVRVLRKYGLKDTHAVCEMEIV